MSTSKNAQGSDRYELRKNSEVPNGWILTDKETQVAIYFDEHQFNETQQVKIPDFMPISSDTATYLAGILSAMSDWLVSNHSFIAFDKPEKRKTTCNLT